MYNIYLPLDHTIFHYYIIIYYITIHYNILSYTRPTCGPWASWPHRLIYVYHIYIYIYIYIGIHIYIYISFLKTSCGLQGVGERGWLIIGMFRCPPI